MRIAWALVVCLGCRQLLGIDDPAIETPIDTRPPPQADAPSSVCVPAGPQTASGQLLGGNAGQIQPTIACPNGELPIGMGFETTVAAVVEGGGSAGERVVVGVGVQCGTISESADGDLAITPTMRRDFGGSLTCNGYSPTVLAAVVNCPPNMFLVGLTGNGGTLSLFNTVAIVCGPLGPFPGQQVSVPVTDTGNFSNNPQSAICESSEAVIGFGIQSGCGIDELSLNCAPLFCQ